MTKHRKPSEPGFPTKAAAINWLTENGFTEYAGRGRYVRPTDNAEGFLGYRLAGRTNPGHSTGAGWEHSVVTRAA